MQHPPPVLPFAAGAPLDRSILNVKISPMGAAAGGGPAGQKRVAADLVAQATG